MLDSKAQRRVTRFRNPVRLDVLKWIVPIQIIVDIVGGFGTTPFFLAKHTAGATGLVQSALSLFIGAAGLLAVIKTHQNRSYRGTFLRLTILNIVLTVTSVRAAVTYGTFLGQAAAVLSVPDVPKPVSREVIIAFCDLFMIMSIGLALISFVGIKICHANRLLQQTNAEAQQELERISRRRFDDFMAQRDYRNQSWQTYLTSQQNNPGNP